MASGSPSGPSGSSDHRSVRAENARRLTGRGFFLAQPGAAVEVWLGPGEALAAVHARWRDAVLGPFLAAIGLGQAEVREHLHEAGFTTAVAAPIDRCLALADALEWAAWSLAGTTEVSQAEAVAAYATALAEQENPALLALEAAAAAHETPFLWDEDAVSLGLGRASEVFLPRALPSAVRWERYGRIPVALVTGTNGKTTTTRMAGRILTAAGLRVGATSTDAITLDGAVLESGDWTGPGAARKVLRHPEVSAAVLETARGGLLRRGLAYDAADAAVVTNIGADHFGDYGITSLSDMARVKAVVWDGVRPGGKRIVNAACPVSAGWVRGAGAVGGRDWVFVARERAALADHLDAGGEGWWVEAGALVHAQTAAPLEVPVVVVALDEVPATFGGAAVHNVENALAAAALAHALGASHDAVRSGLCEFGPSDNPGRLELYALRGVRVLLDFGHNPHGVAALAPVVAKLREHGQRRLMVVAGQAGDRSDSDLHGLCAAIMALGPDRVLLRPMRGYERGRGAGEVEGLMLASLASLGLAPDETRVVDDEVAALEHGLGWAAPGDVVLVLAHIQRDAVRAWVADRLA